MRRFTSPTMGLLILSLFHAGCSGADAAGAAGDIEASGGTSGNEGAGARAGSSAVPGDGDTDGDDTEGGDSTERPGDKGTGGSRATGGGGNRADDGDDDDGKEDGSAGAADDTGAGGTNAGGKNAGGTDAGGTDAGGTSAGGGTGDPEPIDDDADDDGIADEGDLCPNTPAGTGVTLEGCELASDPGAQIPWGQPVPPALQRPVPETGSVEENGFMNFVVDPHGAHPMVFRALSSNVTRLDQGFHVSGTMLLDVPGGTVALYELDATLELAAGGDAIETLRGRARVPFPEFGGEIDLEVDAPVAEFGLENGKNLADLKAPLVNDRRYLYFRFSDQLKAEVGVMKVAIPGGLEHTLVLDHTDPMFFMRANLTGLPGMPIEIENAGIGFSRQGLLPFKPKNAWGLQGPAVDGFSGQMYLEMSGGVGIPGTPIKIGGDSVSVIDLDPARTGRTVFTDPENGLRLGTNRAIELGLDLIPGTASIDLVMGDGTLDLSLLKDAPSASISGVIYPGHSFFNEVVPILPKNEVKVAATIAHPVSDSRFAMSGDVTLGLSKLGSLAGLSLSDIPLVQGKLSADKNGLSIHGNAGASFLSSLGIAGGASIHALFPGSAEASDWFVEMNGTLSVSGVYLSGQTNARLDRTGVAVNGKLATSVGRVDMAGRIDSSGVNLKGVAGVEIPIRASKKELRDFVNGAVCGHRIVQNGLICGFETVTGWIACGVEQGWECIIRPSDCEEPKCNGAANSCPDPNQPLSCPQEVTIPDFNYGTFRGNVEISIGSNGASGKVAGSFCTPNNQCVSVPSGSVDVSSSQVCVQVPVPGLSQEFCKRF